MQRRQVEVFGDHQLWTEQCDWSIIECEKELVTSESDREAIASALAHIDGQFLKEIQIDPPCGECCFRFELDISFNLRRYVDFEPDDPLWSLYSPSSVISYIASGRIEYGSGEEEKPQSIHSDGIRLVL